MKLKKVIFNQTGFRNLIDFKIDISPKITIIAGHNGIGKSTILGLIANGSEWSNNKTLLNKAFRADFSELFFLDYYKDFADRAQTPSTATLSYAVGDTEVLKECAVSGTHKKLISKKAYKKFMVKVNENDLTDHQKSALNGENLYVYRMRVIPRLKTKHNKDFLDQHDIGGSAKIKIPTLYLGMSRISPIGEFDWGDIGHSITNIPKQSIEFIYNFFNSIIPFANNPIEKNIYTHSFSKNNKNSLVPEFGHSSLSISLGQDSISTIATALASFNGLKHSLGSEYRGGILVIDEIEAGLHPRAQKNLIKQLKKYSDELNLQIIATSHSLTIIKELTNDNVPKKYKQHDIVYLIDTNMPDVMRDASYLKIKNDMLLETTKAVSTEVVTVNLPPKIYIYFEDLEAYDLFKGILHFKNITDTYSYFGRDFELVPAKLGCNNLIKLNKTPHFKESIIILDSDMLEGDNKNIKESLQKMDNVLLLPSTNPNSQYYFMPPDKLIYFYLLDKFQNMRENQTFWRQQTPQLFTTNYYLEKIKDINLFHTSEFIPQPETSIDVKNIHRKALKNWYNGVREELIQNHFFSLWASEHSEECDAFLQKLTETVSTTS